MLRSPQWMDLYQIWFRVSSRGRNQMCGILLQSAHGFRFREGSKFAISRWLGRSPLTQCWRYRAACDVVITVLSTNLLLRATFYKNWFYPSLSGSCSHKLIQVWIGIHCIHVKEHTFTVGLNFNTVARHFCWQSNWHIWGEWICQLYLVVEIRCLDC